jgi:hypothetical protein
MSMVRSGQKYFIQLEAEMDMDGDWPLPRRNNRFKVDRQRPGSSLSRTSSIASTFASLATPGGSRGCAKGERSVHTERCRRVPSASSRLQKASCFVLGVLALPRRGSDRTTALSASPTPLAVACAKVPRTKVRTSTGTENEYGCASAWNRHRCSVSPADTVRPESAQCVSARTSLRSFRIGRLTRH